MAAMAPALTDAPAEARHIRLKLAAASSGLSPSSVENNSNATNILLSSSVSQSAASSNGKRHHLPTCHEDSCRCSRNCKVQHQEALAVSKLQPLVASYLCSDVVPVAKEPLKSHVLLNGSLFHSSRSGNFFLCKSLSGGQPKGLVNGTGTGGGGSAMVPVNGLAKKVAVPSTALPEKGSVATVNGDNSKPLASGEALLPLSSKSGVTVPVMFVPRADSKHQRELTNVSCRAPEDTGVGGPAESQELKSEMVHPPASCLLQSTRGFSERNFVDIDLLEDPQTSGSTQSDHSTAPRSSSPKLEVLLRERANQSQSRQSEISGRLRRLCKRIQVVQAKQVERHVRQQLSGFVDCALTQAASFTEVNTWRGSQRSADSWAESLGNFMKGGSVPSELEKLHLSGSTHLRMAEAGFDSDATESSSGGESDVEEEELTQVDIEQRHVKLWRRAEGRFALERASIISRWTWLQAQISDLEYRIRQHADIYRQIRASKGPVELRDTSPLGQAKVEPMEHLPSQNATENRSQSSQCRSSRSMNGFLHSNMAEISDSSCTAARIRPLTNCKRRRLIQPSLVQNLSGKVQSACCSPTWLCEVNASCVMCGSSRLYPKGEPCKLPLVDRAALQDPNIHPTLSLQSDLPLSVQLQRALKSHWLTRHIEEVKPLKKVSLKHKLSPFTSSSSSMLTKRKFRLPNSHMAAIKFSRHKSRSDRSRRQQGDVRIRSHKLDTHVTHSPCAPERLLDRSLSRKRMREPSLVRTDTPKLLSDAMSPCSSQPNVLPCTFGILSRQLSLPTDSSTPLTPSSSCSMPIRKKRSENSFDINNIVIPMSVAATTRVEKLQYKEIITPSWRTVDLFFQPLADGEEDVEVEDLSDAAFAQLHQKCEDQERSRWRWTTLAPAKRRGSRSYKSLDGRTTPSLSGTNPSTPQPSSPDTGHFHLLQDYGPVPSPLSPASPDTPCSRDSHTPHVKDPYRLTYSEDTRCSTPDCTYEERTVQPWDRRTFPLPEDPEAEPEEEAHQILPISMRTSRFRNGSESEASSP